MSQHRGGGDRGSNAGSLPVAKLADPVSGSPALTSEECVRSISYIRFFGVPDSLGSSIDGAWPSVDGPRRPCRLARG